jgi:hypothetical protein
LYRRQQRNNWGQTGPQLYPDRIIDQLRLKFSGLEGGKIEDTVIILRRDKGRRTTTSIRADKGSCCDRNSHALDLGTV